MFQNLRRFISPEESDPLKNSVLSRLNEEEQPPTWPMDSPAMQAADAAGNYLAEGAVGKRSIPFDLKMLPGRLWKAYEKKVQDAPITKGIQYAYRTARGETDPVGDLQKSGEENRIKINELTTEKPESAITTPEESRNRAEVKNQKLRELMGLDKAEELAMDFGTGPSGMIAGTMVGKGAKRWADLPGKFSHLGDKMERAEISDHLAKLKPGWRDKLLNRRIGEDVTWGGVWDHPELYKQYPHLEKEVLGIHEGVPWAGATARNSATNADKLLINRSVVTIGGKK